MVSALVCQGLGDRSFQVVEVVGDEVRQVGILGMVPALLDGVQFRGIRREPLELEPARMVFLKIRRRRASESARSIFSRATRAPSKTASGVPRPFVPRR